MPKRKKFRKPKPGKCTKLPNGAFMCRMKGRLACYRIMTATKARAFMKRNRS